MTKEIIPEHLARFQSSQTINIKGDKTLQYFYVMNQAKDFQITHTHGDKAKQQP
jgi:hypothetical protein